MSISTHPTVFRIKGELWRVSSASDLRFRDANKLQCEVRSMPGNVVARIMIIAILLTTGVGVASAQQKSGDSNSPNILMIMGDDIGYWNLSTYNYPPRAKPGSFSLDQALEKMQQPTND